MNYYNISIAQRLIMAVVSGFLIYPLSFLKDLNLTLYAEVTLVDVLIGAAFALLVMVPFQKRRNTLNALLMVVFSIAIYTFMVRLTVTQYGLFGLELNFDLALILSGGLGAVLTGLTVQILAPLTMKKSGYLLLYVLLLAIGCVAGYVLKTTIDSSSALINAVGFAVWQASVCLVIAESKK